MNVIMSENQIVQAIKAGDQEGIKQLYQQYFKMIADLIQKNSGTREDAEDIFQETLITVITKIRSSEFQLTSRLSSFLYAISKNMWLYRLRGEKRLHFIDTVITENEMDQTQVIELEIYEEKHKLIAKVFDHISQECQKILKTFYFEKKALKDIGTEMNYTEGSIRVKKSRCMESLRKLVEDHPDYKSIMANES